MLNQIEIWIQNQCPFHEGKELYLKFGQNPNLLHHMKFATPKDKVLRGLIKSELSKLIKSSGADNNNKEQIKSSEVFKTSELSIAEPAKKPRDWYPNINFNEQTPNSDIANILFGRQIASFKARMVAQTQLLELQEQMAASTEYTPVTKAIIDNDIENRMCIKELTHYNTTGTFLGKHPYFETADRLQELKNLKDHFPEVFFKTIYLCYYNIDRYKNKPKHKDLFDKHEQDKKLILQLFK